MSWRKDIQSDHRRTLNETLRILRRHKRQQRGIPLSGTLTDMVVLGELVILTATWLGKLMISTAIWLTSIFKWMGGKQYEAARLYRLAIDQGDADAQFRLAAFYEKGGGFLLGFLQDDREAARFYRLAADQGHADAQYMLGLFYQGGFGGLPEDHREAARLYRLAADQGHIGARAKCGHNTEEEDETESGASSEKEQTSNRGGTDGGAIFGKGRLGEAWYETLGVLATATPEEIKNAYRNRMKKNHPDRVADLDPEFRTLAEERAKRLNAAREEGLARWASMDRSKLDSAAKQVNFPNLEAMTAYPFRREQSVSNVPQIYLMYSPLDRAGRVGSCGGNTQFKRHAKPSVATTGGTWGPSWGWFEDMHLSTPPDGRKGMADSLRRLESSNFCWDAHRWGADRFVYYVLALVPHLNVAERRCLEQEYMDALRDQTDLEDYTGQSACTCSLHPAPRKYVRRRRRAATWR